MGLTRKQIAMLAVLIFGAFVTILNQTLITPAQPSIMAEMGIGASTVQWLTTGFTLVNAVMIPITAYLTDRFTTRRLFVVALSIFTCGTLLAAFSPNFPVLLAGRMVQACGAGILMPMVGVVMMLTFPVERRGTAMGLFGVVMMLAPAIGPTLGGVIVDHASFHYMFFGIATLVVITIVVSLFVIEKEQKAVPDGLYLDKLSVVLSTLGFGGMLYGFSIIGSNGFSITALVAVLLGAIICVFFFRRQLKLDVPMLEVRVLKTRRFAVATAIGMVIQGSIMANGILIPIYVQTLAGHSATASGLVMLPGALIMGIMSPIAGRLFDKNGPRGMAITGLSLLTIGTVGMAMMQVTTPLWVLCIVVCVRNFSMSLVNMPLNTWGMNALENRYINHGNAVSNTLRQVAGAFGAAIVVSIYSLVSSVLEPSMGTVQSCMAAFDVAFWVQVVLTVIALVLTFTMVRDRATDMAQADPTNEKKDIVESLMHRDVYTVPSTAKVSEAVTLLLEKGISAAPVVNEGGEVIGFVSDGDVIRALTNHTTINNDPLATMLIQVKVDEDLQHKMDAVMDMPVSTIATGNCISVDVHASISEICHVMGDNHLKKVPVTEGGKIVGVINRSDITRAALGTYLAKGAQGSS